MRLHRRHRRRHRKYTPMSKTASHGNHEKINSWASFSFLYGYGAPLGGPLDHQSSAIMSLLGVKGLKMLVKSVQNGLHSNQFVQKIPIM